MGRRLSKGDLLAEAQRERRALDDTLALLSARQMTKAGVTHGGWSVKDILAHLVEWQRMNLDWYSAGVRGDKPAMPAPGYTLRELPRLNQEIYRKHHRRPLAAVLEDYRSYHERVLNLIESLPDADLVTMNRFSWTGPSWTLSDYLRASTAAHYLWARTRIRRWWRATRKRTRTAGVLFALSLSVPVGLSARGSIPIEPDDLLFAEQCSFHAPGKCEWRLSTRRVERVSVDVAPGAALNMPAAWALTTGSKSVVVAVLDDGFFYQHEDIEPNLWRNPGETGVDSLGRSRLTNRVDDDGDGYVDDVIGWDFVFDDPDPDPYVFDGMDRTRIQPYWHSISALGIIGAKGNNAVGVAGINWDVSLMLLKIGAQGIRRGEVDSLRARRAAQAIRFAADHGARVLNWSGFLSDNRPEGVAHLREAVRYAAARGVLMVVGAGNDFRDIDKEENCLYPQCLDEPNMIRVAQLASDGSLYEYVVGGQRRGSNHGTRRVEVAAMGEHFTAGLSHNISTYEMSNGTSSAGPVVTGVAALVLSVRPTLTTSELRQVLLESATRLPSLEGKVQSGRAINPQGAVQQALRMRR